MTESIARPIPPEGERPQWLGRAVDDRRTRILWAAQEVFASEGFRSAEVRSIAIKAGVGKATIYKFFASKEALLLSVVEESLEHMRDIALASLASDGPPLGRLEQAARALARFLVQNREFARVLIQEAGEFMGDIQRKHLAIVEQNMAIAESFFASLRHEGYFRALNVPESCHLLVNVMVGATYTWALTGTGDLEQQAIRNLRVLIEGLRADPATISRPD